MKVLDRFWYSTRDGLLGIVQVETQVKEIKYYIGHVPNVTTDNEDAQYVAQWGAKFDKTAGDVLFGRV